MLSAVSSGLWKRPKEPVGCRFHARIPRTVNVRGLREWAGTGTVDEQTALAAADFEGKGRRHLGGVGHPAAFHSSSGHEQRWS